MHLLRRLAAILIPLVLAASACDGDLDVQRRDAPASTAATSRSAPTAEARSTVSAPQFAPGQLEQHFAKHGAEMGFATKEDYLRAAQALVCGGPGVETFQRGGNTLFFKESTDEFAVLSERGVIRTYFKPSDGRRYWERQKQR
jgi:pyocin large subunit-like protein